MQSVELASLTYEEAKAILDRGAYALLPAGATEAHGPHLPLATDVIISREGAIRAAHLLKSEGIEALVLPPIAYAVTEFGADFSGTISLPIETARALLRDVILGAMRTGFRGVVICNAHLEPGNLQAIREAIEEANARGGKAAFPDVTRKPHALRLGEEFRSGACHAGSYETSLVLAAEGALVHEEVAHALPSNPTSLSRAIRDGKKSFREAGGERAYFGQPAEASREEGETLYREMADVFASAVREMQ